MPWPLTTFCQLLNFSEFSSRFGDSVVDWPPSNWVPVVGTPPNLLLLNVSSLCPTGPKTEPPIALASPINEDFEWPPQYHPYGLEWSLLRLDFPLKAARLCLNGLLMPLLVGIGLLGKRDGLTPQFDWTPPFPMECAPIRLKVGCLKRHFD